MTSICNIDGSAVADDPLASRTELGGEAPLRVCFPLVLDGDLVMTPEHLGVAYLAAVLRSANALCRIIEVKPAHDLAELAGEIAAWTPDIVGLSLTSIGVNRITAFGNELRALCGDTAVMVGGGPLATHHGAHLLHNPSWSFLDAVIRGEGEVPLLRYAEALRGDRDFSVVPNLAYRTKDGVAETPMQRGIQNLDLLPFPSRDQLETRGKLPYVRISTSRGCTSHCTFCNAPHTRNHLTTSKVWRGASPERVVDEVERIYRDYCAATFDFVDSTFEDPGNRQGKRRVLDIAEEVIRRDLKIYYNCCMQAKNWHEEDRETLRILVRSGLEKVLIGIESGTETGLRRWNKRSTVEDNRRIIRLLREAGVYVAFGFISYHPWSTFEEIRENYAFLRTEMGHNLRRFTTRIELYPGAEMIGQLRADGLLARDYEETLNPFAYRYADERVGKLAFGFNRLYGDDYARDCTIAHEPAVFKFETYDIVLHTFGSRLRRLFGERADAADILADLDAEVGAIRASMSSFNAEVAEQFVSAAEQEGDLSPLIERLRPEVEGFYQSRIDALSTCQLKASMRMHRAGVPVRSIAIPSVPSDGQGAKK